MNSTTFDVFLSYSRADQAIVERVAQGLHAGGLRVFLDRWYLAAGRSWPEALEDALAGCRAVAILLGPDGLGPWQQREQYKALDRQTKEPAFPVIPVVLPGTKDPALGFLGLNTWVDLRSDLDCGLELLAKAVRGEPAGPTEQRRDPRAEVCPYRGLQPFREEDAPFFCGREAFTTTLLKRIATEDLIAVVGASGSGKSSVVRAGLVPALRRGEDQSRVWEVAVLRPGRDPFQALAASLLPPDPGIDEFDRIALLRQRAEQLRTGEVPIPDVATRVLEKQPGTDRVLLVIDQAEELFTLTEDPAQRRRFMELLLNATRKAPLTVVLTLRGDFYGRALEDRDLADHLDRGVVNLGPMTRDELARAIREPAAKVDLGFEDGLVERILTDVGDEPGKLPLMEFLLEGLWQRRTRGCLTHRAYDDLGGVPGAIAKRADAEFGRLTAEQQAAARRFLVLLVSPGEGREDTRAVAELPKGDLLVEDVVRHFADARLLVTNHDASGQHELVEMSHEALIRSWTELRRWVDENREFLRTLRRVEEAENLWSTEGCKPDRLLQQGRPLGEAEDLIAKRPEFVNKDLNTYISASQSRARRAARLRNLVSIVAVILAIVAIAGGSVAWWQRGEAQRNAEEAQHNTEAAQRNESRALASLAENEVERGSPATAVHLALAALSRRLDSPDRAYARVAEGALLYSVQHLRERRRFLHENWVSSVAFSPDGRTLATGSWDKTARLWEVATGTVIGVLRGHENDVSSVAFSPDGRTLATGSYDRTARLWEVATGKELGVLRGHENDVSSVAFSPDGRTLATGAIDNTARLWEVATGTVIGALRGHEQSVSSVAFSPDGRTLATGSWDKTARLWEVATGKEIGVLRHKNSVKSVAFSPDGRTLATGSSDKTARLWEVATGQDLGPLRGHEDDVSSVAFSPDGRTLATGAIDNTARLWEVATGTVIGALRGHEDDVSSVAFSPDGRTLATGSEDNTARLWEVATGTVIGALRGHEQSVSSVAFSPDGRTLATGSWDKTARLWEVATGKEIGVLRHKNSVKSVAFSPDGRTLATGSSDKTARLWEVATGQDLGPLRGHEDDVSSVAFSPDGRTLATGSYDRTARLWEVATGQDLGALRGHEDDVSSVAFSPDGRTLATGSEDNTARLWEVATGTVIAVLRHEGSVSSVAFSPDGRTLATDAIDNTARLWEVATGTVIAVLRHEGSVSSVAFSPDGRTLALSDKLWEVATGKQIGVLRGHERGVSSVAFSPDGRTLATGSSDKTARLWEVGQDLVDLACARVRFLPLSEEDRQRFGITKEWCTPEVSAALRTELRLDETQNNLGSALETGTKRLEEAVEAYRAALQKQTRERVPLDWAMTQNNLGSALWGLGERESSTKRLEAAAASFSDVLQVDPDNKRAYNALNILYHDKLFAFAEAFDLNQAWLERHPDSFGAQANFAEAAFTVGRFAEAEQRLASLMDRPELEPGTRVALRALEICSLIALDRPDALRTKLDALSDLLKDDRNELTADWTWTFAGSRHFIGEHPELSRHPWLIRLLAAIEERNVVAARAAVGAGATAAVQ